MHLQGSGSRSKSAGGSSKHQRGCCCCTCACGAHDSAAAQLPRHQRASGFQGSLFGTGQAGLFGACQSAVAPSTLVYCSLLHLSTVLRPALARRLTQIIRLQARCQCTDSSSSRGRCPPTTSLVATMRPLEPSRSLPLQQTACDPRLLQEAYDCRSTAITASAETPRAMHIRILLHSLPHHSLHADTHGPSHPPS